VREPAIRRSGSKSCETTRHDVGGEEREREPDRQGYGRRDQLEREERGEAEQRQAGERRELLRDADVARAGGDADADPDRPQCEERGEQDLGEQLWRVPDDRADDVRGAEADADRDDEVDGIRDCDRGEKCRNGLSEQKLGGAERAVKIGSRVPWSRSPTTE
jgi:hypothetical protein